MALIASLFRLMLLQGLMAIKADPPCYYLPYMRYMATTAITVTLQPVKPKLSGLIMTFKALTHARFDLFMGMMTGVAIKLHRCIQSGREWDIWAHLLMTGKTDLPLREEGGGSFR